MRVTLPTSHLSKGSLKSAHAVKSDAMLVTLSTSQSEMGPYVSLIVWFPLQ